MKETLTIAKRLTLTTPKEKATAKSWGSLWSTFGSRDRSGKGVFLIFGDWSGYTSSQSRITHIGWCYHKIPDDYEGTVKFTDGTTMSVWTKRVTRADIIRFGWSKKETYSDLINKLIEKGTGYYDVAADSKKQD